MSLTKEEFDKRLDEISWWIFDQGLRQGLRQGYDQATIGRSESAQPVAVEAEQYLRQLILDLTDDPIGDCDYCWSLDSIREIVKGDGDGS